MDEITSHSQTSTVLALKFGIGEVISSHMSMGIWLFLQVGIKVNPC